jgi:hypothetical protein
MSARARLAHLPLRTHKPQTKLRNPLTVPARATGGDTSLFRPPAGGWERRPLPASKE